MLCSAVNCSNRSSQGVRLFRFPVLPELRQIWINNTRRGQWIPTDSDRLCSVHFEKNQFERIGLDGYIKLKWDAVPTIFNVPNAPMRLMPERKLKYKTVNSNSETSSRNTLTLQPLAIPDTPLNVLPLNNVDSLQRFLQMENDILKSHNDHLRKENELLMKNILQINRNFIEHLEESINMVESFLK